MSMQLWNEIKSYVKVLQLKQNPQNGRTDYGLSMRAVNQQTGVEQSTDQQPQQRMQYQQRQQPPPQQQQQQQDRQQLRVNGTTRILPSGYSGSKANMIPLGKKRNFGAMSTDSSNGSTGNNISTTNSTYQYQQPTQPSVGMNNNSNNAPPPPQGLFKSAPAPFKAAPAPFKAAPAPFKAAPAPPAGLFKSAPAPQQVYLKHHLHHHHLVCLKQLLHLRHLKKQNNKKKCNIYEILKLKMYLSRV